MNSAAWVDNQVQDSQTHTLLKRPGHGLREARAANSHEAAVTELLEGHVSRTARVPTATGRGLFLWKVFY